MFFDVGATRARDAIVLARRTPRARRANFLAPHCVAKELARHVRRFLYMITTASGARKAGGKYAPKKSGRSNLVKVQPEQK